MQQLTLAFLLTEKQICLAVKKRGFGEGFYNGYGGKLEENESLTEAACREIYEESGVRVSVEDLEKVATHSFIYLQEGELEVHVYLVRDWQGEPVETPEMRPQWFDFAKIPYEEMWADDRHWLPRVLAGEKISGQVWFGETGTDIVKMEFASE